MVPKTVLEQAKAFLCWDTFPDLTVQLVELRETAAYFFPPSNGRSTIVVFHQKQAADFSRPIFLLFHEAGHLLQSEEWEKDGRTNDFRKILDESAGSIRAAFEQESWKWGRELLKDFLQKNGLDQDLLAAYDRYAETCMRSYR
ncbi:MAG TPA: hypothetical protein VGB38_02475 [bacterium]